MSIQSFMTFRRKFRCRSDKTLGAKKIKNAVRPCGSIGTAVICEYDCRFWQHTCYSSLFALVFVSRQFLEKLRIFVYNVTCIVVSIRKERRMKGYLSIRETSYKWGISERRVNQYVAQGRIPGVERFGRSWAIPDDAVKPTDPRKKMPAIPDTNIKTK